MASPTLNAARIGRTWRAQLRVVFVFLALLAVFNGLYQVERRFAGEYFDIPYSALVTRSVAHLSTWLLTADQIRRVSQNLILKDK